MEFKEFTSPEEKDYDIKSNLDSLKDSFSVNPYSEQLTDLIGILEDVTEEEMQEQYGINANEYFNPNADTIKKVQKKLNELSSRKHR